MPIHARAMHFCILFDNRWGFKYNIIVWRHVCVCVCVLKYLLKSRHNT